MLSTFTASPAIMAVGNNILEIAITPAVLEILFIFLTFNYMFIYNNGCNCTEDIY
jgi:hypothetical protein